MSSVRSVPVQVYVVSPPMVCWGLERLVQSAHPRFELAGTAATLSGAAAQLQASPPDVVVLDLEGSDGIDQVADLQGRTPAKFLIVTNSTDVAMLDRAVLAGVRGVVRKSDPAAILLKAIDNVNEGELWIDRSATSRIFMEMARQKSLEGKDPERTKIATLTLRERQTIAAVASDASAPCKVIADRLCISEHTLRNHLSSIYSKLGLSNRLGLYAYVTRNGLTKTP